MQIKVLAENTSAFENFGSEHGLSLYIETNNHKILFDTGASSLFAENAGKMNVDLSGVDVAVLSHGHFDHGGGLKVFTDINSKAKIFCRRSAFENHYAKRPNGDIDYIGLDGTLLETNSNRFAFCGEQLIIDKELELFSGVKGDRLYPPGNSNLLIQAGDSFFADDFSHEQNLIIRENGKSVLIVGCAHRGIVNIIEHYRTSEVGLPDYIIGGFHLKYNGNNDDNRDIISQIGRYLSDTQVRYYTCHCTGIEAFDRLKTIMGDQIDYISAGSQLEI